MVASLASLHPYFSQDDISSEEATKLFEALKSNTSLTTLNIYCSSFKTYTSFVIKKVAVQDNVTTVHLTETEPLEDFTELFTQT